jgi:type II secretory pathway component PulM
MPTITADADIQNAYLFTSSVDLGTSAETPRGRGERAPVGSRRGPIIAAVGVVVIAILLFLIVVLPKMRSVSDAQSQLDAARRQTTLEVRAALEQAARGAEEPARHRERPQADPADRRQAALIQLLNGAAVSAGISSFR